MKNLVKKKEIRLVVCTQNGCVCTVLDYDIAKMIQFNRLLLLKLKEIVLDEHLTKKQKCTKCLNLKYFDKDASENIVDYF